MRTTRKSSSKTGRSFDTLPDSGPTSPGFGTELPEVPVLEAAVGLSTPSEVFVAISIFVLPFSQAICNLFQREK